MKTLKKLFDQNKKWADGLKESEPDFFTNLAKGQSPEYLWIGCSDSRLPAGQLLGLLPGELFVHRNIANLVIHTDLNCLSVIQYAVEALKVKHIIVCGHYGCGGVQAAMDNIERGTIDNWLINIRHTYRFHQDRLDAVHDEKSRIDLLCELNVVEQTLNVCESSVVQRAWKSGQKLSVHGWIYNIEDGLLKDLGVGASSPEEIPALRNETRNL